MIDAKALKQQCSGRWFGLYEYFGIDVGTGAHKSCPLCGGKDRFRVERDGSGYYCNQCNPGSGITLVQKHLGCNFPETLKRINEVLNGVKMDKTSDKTNNKMSEADIKKMLNRIWGGSTELTGSDPVSLYLHARGLVLTPDNVRFCPECWEKNTEQHYPAMIAKIMNKEGLPIALHRTYLSKEGNKKAEIKPNKKLTPGLELLPGGAIRLFPPQNNTIIVCEGIETGIACAQIFDEGVYACISNTILEGFEPPEGIRKIIICGDSDTKFVGQISAYKLAKTLYDKDYIVEVRLPPNMGDDFNDMIGV